MLEMTCQIFVICKINSWLILGGGGGGGGGAGIHDDITRYSQSCDTCQLSEDGPKRKEWQGTFGHHAHQDSFQPSSHRPDFDRGNRWVLTLVDCATRYLEANPMKRTATTDVAEELLVE